MPSHNGRRKSILSRRRRIGSERSIRGRRTSLSGGSSAQEVSSNYNPHSKHRETDYRPFERYRRRKRCKLGPRLRYPSSLRGGGPQTSLHWSRLGTGFWKQLLPNTNDRPRKSTRTDHDRKNNNCQRG